MDLATKIVRCSLEPLDARALLFLYPLRVQESGTVLDLFVSTSSTSVRLRGRQASASCRNASMYRRVAPVPRTRLVVDSGSIERKFIPSRVEFCKTLPAIRNPTFPFLFLVLFLYIYLPSTIRWGRERERESNLSFLPLLIALSDFATNISPSYPSFVASFHLTHFDTCTGHFDACLLMICDKASEEGRSSMERGPASLDRMPVASRNVNRRSIVNLYCACSLDTSRERERKRERQREKVRNSGFFLREDLIPRPRGRASIILPVAVGALLCGNKYIEMWQPTYHLPL